MITSYTEENYLKAIYHLHHEGKNSVSTNSISESLQTRAASVSDMLRKLSEKGLINYTKYQGVTLTEIGKQKAVEIIRKHRLWEVFLVEKLNFKWDEVHDLAEELEHINSEILINKLDEFLDFPKTDPHGDPIPDKNGILKSPKVLPIYQLQIGAEGIISGVKEHSKTFLQYLEKIGLTLGETIKIADKIDFDGSMMVIVNQKSQNISRDVAKNLLIKL